MPANTQIIQDGKKEPSMFWAGAPAHPGKASGVTTATMVDDR
jgi:hypothetical protein